MSVSSAHALFYDSLRQLNATFLSAVLQVINKALITEKRFLLLFLLPVTAKDLHFKFRVFDKIAKYVADANNAKEVV